MKKHYFIFPDNKVSLYKYCKEYKKLKIRNICFLININFIYHKIF